MQELQRWQIFHPRAVKLLRKSKNFLVVAEDEPYFLQTYELIRESEQRKGTWTSDDEERYRAAQLQRAPVAPEQKRVDEEQKQIQCPVCGNWVWLYDGNIVVAHTMNGRVDSPYCKQSSERYTPVSKRSGRR